MEFPVNISKNCIVTLNYTLTDDENKTLDTSVGGEPLVYLHGAQNIIPGLEEALESRKKGDKFKVSIAAEKAYGEHMEEMIQNIPKNQFPPGQDLQPGMKFQANSPQGPIVLTVLEIGETDIVVDGNHPLAGENLNFDVEVAEVRSATEEELNHGHAHGPGGHHDHE